MSCLRRAPPHDLCFRLSMHLAILLMLASTAVLAFQNSRIYNQNISPNALKNQCTSRFMSENDVSDSSSSTATVERGTSESKDCYYKRIDGSWKPRKELNKLFVGERLFARRLAECDLVKGNKTGPKVFLECGIGRKNNKGKWSIVNGMMQLGKRGMKDSVARKKITKLPSDQLFEVYVSKINLDHGSLEVCLNREDALEKEQTRKEIIPASSLKPGQELTGQVKNVTPYGVFIDVGANRNGLLHIKNIAKYQNSYVNKEEGLKKIGLGRGAWVSVLVVSNEGKRLELDLTPKEEDSNENTTKDDSADNIDNNTGMSEDEALAWAAFAAGENDQANDADADEAAMWAAYGSDDGDQEEAFDEDKDIEDSLGIGGW